MNIDVVTATEFRGVVPKGGSTKPWVVEAYDTSGNTDLYVVKMFTPKQIRQQNAVTKEVFLTAVKNAPESFEVLLKKQLI